MKTEHTPGPWLIRDGFVVSQSAGFVPIRTPFREDAFIPKNTTGFSDEVIDANARLMAAAPDMAAALQWVVRGEHHPACPIPRGKGWTTITHDDCTCQVKAARAALAKAGAL